MARALTGCHWIWVCSLWMLTRVLSGRDALLINIAISLFCKWAKLQDLTVFNVLNKFGFVIAPRGISLCIVLDSVPLEPSQTQSHALWMRVVMVWTISSVLKGHTTFYIGLFCMWLSSGGLPTGVYFTLRWFLPAWGLWSVFSAVCNTIFPVPIFTHFLKYCVLHTAIKEDFAPCYGLHKWAYSVSKMQNAD